MFNSTVSKASRLKGCSFYAKSKSTASQSVSHFRKSVQMAETGPKHLSPRSFLDVLGPFPGHVSGGDERAGANCIEGNDGETMYLTAP